MERKILHILSGDTFGGAETQVTLLLSELQKLGADVLALLFNAGTTATHLMKNSVEVEVADEKDGFFSLLSNSRKVVAREKPVCIVTHGYKEALIGALIARSEKAKLVTVFHGHSNALPGFAGIKVKVYNWIHGQIAKHIASNVVCVSSSLARELRLTGLKNLEIIYNAAETVSDDGHEIDVSSPFAPSSNQTNLLVVSRLEPVKNVSLAITSLAELLRSQTSSDNPLHLFIAGDGSQRKELETLALSLNVNDSIHFLGYRSDVSSLIAKADVLVIPSKKEGMPTVLLTALCEATPVAATNVGGIPEVRDTLGEYPLAIAADLTPKALAEAVREIISQRKEIPEYLQQKARALFSAEAMARKHFALYQQK